ncbi:MAG: nucleoside-diphosphate kinase [Opitutales bacterium]|jgi:nucleoside-diphosphate kinase|tara:strand:- start:341 stop:757 length:417 start_codon:yes stop_codon:yes gene_type:complete
MQRSLILLKPDCVKKSLVGQVISRFESAGYSIIASKVVQLDDALLHEHYSHVADLPFFPEIAEFMSSCPVIALVLEGEEVIQGVRDLIGPTDSTIAPKGTIRGDLGTDRMKNMVHASDSPESALAEINRFFEADQIVS